MNGGLPTHRAGIAVALCIGVLSGCSSDEGDESHGDEAMALLRTLSAEVLPAPPADATNDYAEDAAAAEFGQKLFFETRFSGRLLDGDNDGSDNALGVVGETGKVSCAGCHLPSTGFSDTRTLHQQISLGAGWGIRKAPSLLDVAQSKLLMWDGRRDTFYNQIFGVLESPVEANSSRLYVASQVAKLHKDEYESIFGQLPDFTDTDRFPALSDEQTGCEELDADSKCAGTMRGIPGDAADYDGMSASDQSDVTRVVVNLGKALGAYERLLTCGKGRFDEWIAGDAEALTESEQRGAYLFVGKAGCVSCHSGPYFSDERFHNVGLKPAVVATVFLDAWDEGAAIGISEANADPLNSSGDFSDGDDGRLSDAGGDELLGAFRTPRLRCAGSRPAFMHTGQFGTLDEVVAFFNRGGDPNGYPGVNELHALDLTLEERADLVAFLAALEGPGPSSALLGPP